MAYVSGQMLGTVILDSGVGGYTSDLYQTPEYTDVYSAFTKDNTICDKVPPFVEGEKKTLEQLVAEREVDVVPLADTELAAIANFEAKKQQQEKEHFDKVKDYFSYGGVGGSGALNNWITAPSTESDADKTFVIKL
jgi:hypothetical protein